MDGCYAAISAKLPSRTIWNTERLLNNEVVNGIVTLVLKYQKNTKTMANIKSEILRFELRKIVRL